MEELRYPNVLYRFALLLNVFILLNAKTVTGQDAPIFTVFMRRRYISIPPLRDLPGKPVLE